MIKITIIQSETIEELSVALDKMNLDDKFTFSASQSDNAQSNNLYVNEHGEVDGSTFEMLLLKKGYKAKSFNSRKKQCEKLYITSTKRGSKYWYLLADIDRVPRRISRSKVVQLARATENG